MLVEVDRGLDFGRVNSVGDAALAKCGGCTTCGPEDSPATDAAATVAPPPPRVVRRATPADTAQHEELRRGEDTVRRQIMDKVASHGLTMRISDTSGNGIAPHTITSRQIAGSTSGPGARARQCAACPDRAAPDRRADEAARSVASALRPRVLLQHLAHPAGPVNLALAKDQHLSLNRPRYRAGAAAALLPQV